MSADNLRSRIGCDCWNIGNIIMSYLFSFVFNGCAVSYVDWCGHCTERFCMLSADVDNNDDEFDVDQNTKILN